MLGRREGSVATMCIDRLMMDGLMLLGELV